LERRLVPLSEVKDIKGAPRVLAALTDARLLTVGAGTVELSHEALLREWPRYRGWLEEDRVVRQVHAHLRVAAREWDAHGRDQGDLYRGARLAAALEFCAQHADRLDRLEREFVGASQLEADREAGRQRVQNRRLRALLVAGAVLLVLTVVAGVVAVVGQQRASKNASLADAAARAALGRQLGAEALGEQRLDVAALLAREGVALDRSPQTEGTLLTTLLRSPAVLGTFPLPTDSTPHVAVSPDGRTLAVSDSVADSVQFYDAQSRALEPRRLNDFAGDQPPVYSADGSLLVYTSGGSLVVRDARTLALRQRLVLEPPYRQELGADIPEGSTLFSPDGRTVYYAYWLMDAAGQPAQAYLESWAASSGRPLKTIRLGAGPLLAVRQVDLGPRVMVVTAHRVTTYDASTLRQLRALTIRPMSVLPSAAAISPSGSTIALGSQDGSVSFVDAGTGRLRRGVSGQHSAAVASAVFSPSGATAMSVGDDGKVIIWNPGSGRRLVSLPGPAGHIQDAQLSPDGSTLYTAGTGGVMLAWDLTGARGFGRSARLSATLPCCDSVTPEAPAFALSPDGTHFAVATADSKVGVYSAMTLRREKSFAIASAANRVTALAWSPTGDVLAVGAHGGIVQLWDVSGTPRATAGTLARGTRAAPRPD
jgi:WD40 repeat protein